MMNISGDGYSSLYQGGVEARIFYWMCECVGHVHKCLGTRSRYSHPHGGKNKVTFKQINFMQNWYGNSSKFCRLYQSKKSIGAILQHCATYVGKDYGYLHRCCPPGHLTGVSINKINWCMVPVLHCWQFF